MAGPTPTPEEPGRRTRAFGRLLGASGLSNLADGIAKIALPLLAVTHTRSAVLVAGVEVVRSLPWLVGALPIGALVDRLDRRRTMLLANMVRAAAVAAAAASELTGAGTIWGLYILALATGVAEVFHDTAAQSLLPRIVPRHRLDRANGRLLAVELGAQEFVGPPLGGLLVAAAAGAAFGASAGLWVVALLVLASIRGHFRPSGPRPVNLRADIREGLSFLLGRPMLRTMAAMVGAFNLASSAVFAVLVLHAVGPDSELGLDEPGFGLLLTAITAGSLVGGVTAEVLQRRIGRSALLKLTVLGNAGYLVALTFSSSVAVIAASAVVAGLTNMLWNVTTVSFRQRVTPDHLLGRLNSAYRLLAWGSRPLGAALGGVVAEIAGTRATFALAALVAAALAVPVRTLTEEALTAAENQAEDEARNLAEGAAG